MSEQSSAGEYLVVSRGQWDSSLSRDDIEKAIDDFYTWYDRLAAEGKIRRGQRLTYEGRTVLGSNVITDGPFGESKEVIGGFAILEATSLKEAIELTKRFLRIHGDEWDVECEVRQMEGPDFDTKV